MTLKKAVKEPLRLRNNDLSEQYYGIYMEDYEIHDEPLTIVSNDYEIVQHEEIIDSLDLMIKKIDAVLERDIITTNDGARMFAKYNLPNVIEPVKHNDEVNMGILVTNSYDKSRSIQIRIYGIRINCINVLNTNSHLSMMKTRHFKSSLDKFFEISVPTFLSKSSIEFMSNIHLWRRYVHGGTVADAEQHNEMLTKIKELLPKKDFVPIEAQLSSERNLWNIYNILTTMMTHEWEIEKQLRFANPMNDIMNATLDAVAE